MPRPRELLAIPVRRSTWRRIGYLMIGAGLAAPYLVPANFAVAALDPYFIVGVNKTWDCGARVPVGAGEFVPT